MFLNGNWYFNRGFEPLLEKINGMNPISRIVIIGTGNVAEAFAKAFYKKGLKILQVIGRNPEKVSRLSDMVNAESEVNFQNINPSADFYLIAVSDDAIETVALEIPEVNGIVAHTSGAMSIEVLTDKHKYCAVFYPVYSFWGQEVDFSNVPLCIEGNHQKAEAELTALAHQIQAKPQVLSSEERLKIHLAAVMANNFTNYLWLQSEAFLSHYQLDFKILLPLIQQSSDKLRSNSAAESQTGPAKRGDRNTIEKHLELLKGNEELLGIYRNFTHSIYDYFHEKNK